MNPKVKLFELLGNKAVIEILEFFFKNPTQKFSQIKIRKKIKLAKATATKWLDKITKENLILVEKQGPTKFYELNRENNLIKQLKILHNLSYLNEVRNLAQKFNSESYLYGSSARGEDVEESDIDILIIGKVKKEEIIKEIEKLSSKIKKEIKTEIFSDVEWSQMARKDPAFYERVEKDKIKL